MTDREKKWAELFKAETGFEHMTATPHESLEWFRKWSEETHRRLQRALPCECAAGRVWVDGDEVPCDQCSAGQQQGGPQE